jgi:hypothetical protein
MRLAACALGGVGQLISGPAYAAGDGMPAIAGVIQLAILCLAGWALGAVALKRLALLVGAFWAAALALMIAAYGLGGAWDRSVMFAVLLLGFSLPFVGGCLLRRVARKHFSGVGTRHG